MEKKNQQGNHVKTRDNGPKEKEKKNSILKLSPALLPNMQYSLCIFVHSIMTSNFIYSLTRVN